ncbi:linolenate hydroperoxide lyase, chloroplastic [Dioscorea cayenensis subsp. rotundata]|uniref:Linolenate hydroperoxide lyase, chloroplastic n=1 Tax=Dioscorea cayennensis subsp. rotundata TaxID=55577 RepID=A0AB40CUY8_DIOCR|nr:linolenate hydroperoxide lyase, chloroplastic [Dioscorea cayenensis subsp. rotundata]
MMSVSMMWPSASTATSLPVKAIPGSYGPPVVGPLKDRLDYFWFQGTETFFRSRMATYKSSVFRTNMPPTFPFFTQVDPRVIAVLDCSSFSALFDISLVDKRNVLIGDFMPSLKFTGGTRVGVYLDPTEPKHKLVKNFCFDILKRSSRVWISEFLRHSDLMLNNFEKEIDEKGSTSFFIPMQKCIFAFLCKGIAGADPSKSKEIEDTGFALLDSWLALQLLPTVKTGAIPQPLEELLLHSFPYPFFFVSGAYRKLYEFIEKEGQETIELAESEYNLGKEEAIHNILFVLGFNAYGGFSIFFNSLISTIGKDKNGLRPRLKSEVRRVLLNGKRSINFETVKEMELVRSTVYEVLRLNPPVPLQYGRARVDFELPSHDSLFQVSKGELLCGYQPLAMRDPMVFKNPEEFVPDRFAKDKELLKYLFWSNGPETSEPTTGNKQCAAKDHVVWTSCMLVAQIFNRYDSFECDEAGSSIVKLEKAT